MIWMCRHWFNRMHKDGRLKRPTPWRPMAIFIPVTGRKTKHRSPTTALPTCMTSPHCSLLFCVKPCEIHPVLRASQWEMISALPFSSSFLHNPKFRLSDCSAFHLLSRWFLARLIFIPCRWRPYVPPKHLLTFNWLHGVIYQKRLYGHRRSISKEMNFGC
jgi:hypothetical protein